MIVNLKSSRSNYLARTETLVKYYEDIRKYNLLSSEEENRLFKIIKEGDKKDSEIAKKIVVNSNQRFVVAIAKKFGTNDNILDLIDEGNIGLMEAIEKFDYKKGIRFITFAVHYIRREINNFNINYGSIVKKNNLSKTYHIISKATNRFIQSEFRKPSSEELMEILNKEYGVDIKNISDIIDTKIMYIDEKYDSDDDSQNIGDSSLFNTYSSSYNSIESNASNEFNSLLVSNMLNCLSKRDSTIIKMLFGIGYDREYEIQEIAEKLGLTTERVRQLKISSINRLKKEYKETLNKI